MVIDYRTVLLLLVAAFAIVTHSLNHVTDSGSYNPPLIMFCSSFPCIVCRHPDVDLHLTDPSVSTTSARSLPLKSAINPASGASANGQLSIDETRCELEQHSRADEHARTCPNTAGRRLCVCVARFSWCVRSTLRHCWWNRISVSLPQESCDVDRTCSRLQVSVRPISTLSMFRRHTTGLT